MNIKKHYPKVTLAASLMLTFLATTPASAQISEVRGGGPTQNKDFKGIASIGYMQKLGDGNYTFAAQCTGTLVSPTRVLTGVKCLNSDTIGVLFSSIYPIYVLFPKDLNAPFYAFRDNEFSSIKEVEKAGFIVREIKRNNVAAHPSFDIA